MGMQDNKAISRRFFEEVWSGRNLDALDELTVDDLGFTDRDAGELRGRDAARELVSTYRHAFPDLRFEIEEQIAEGDRVVTRWTARGTHRGELMGIPPTENSTKVSGVTIDRLADGRIAESTGVWDAFGMFQQLGILSAEPSARD